MIYIFFGKAGAGKSYAAKLLAEHFGVLWIEGDDYLTEDMKHAIETKTPITYDMVNYYLNEVLLSHVYKNYLNFETDVFLSQAFYCKKNRDDWREVFGDQVTFVHVDTENDICFKRLKEAGGWITPQYAKDMVEGFEAPNDEKVFVLNNDEKDGREKLVMQFERQVGE